MRRRSRLGLIAALLLALNGEGAAEDSGFIGRFVWRSDQVKFGGYSSIDLRDGGARFIAVTDRGWWSHGRLIRDAQGRITGIDAAPQARLKNTDGKPLRGYPSDAEGLAVAPDGTAFLSFEGPARVWRFPGGLDGLPEPLPSPREFAAMPKNEGLEALAIGPDGALYTLPEDSRSTRPFPLYRFRDGKWDVAFRISRAGLYVPVGADVGPDGRLYVLERAFTSPLTGFSSRIRRFDLSSTGETAGETLLVTPHFRFGDLEGISVWRDAANGLRATMIADDNFSMFLSTEIVEYRLPDQAVH
ncbi:MAG: esterase-like activity of phytase family protein [Paracoccaceae bacterium]